MVECPYCGYVHKPKEGSMKQFFNDDPIKPIEWIGDESFENLQFESDLVGYVFGKECPKCKKPFINVISKKEEKVFILKEDKS
jgi:phage FluMu protein Com